MANEKRLIDAKTLMENGWHLVKTGESNKFLASMSLADVPTVDAVEVVHGRWIWHDEDEFFACSNCEYSALNNYRGNSVESNYCHNCGAKMDGGNEDEQRKA